MILRSFSSLFFVCAVFGVVLPVAATAENGNGGGQYSIGVVNVKEVFDNYEKQTALYEELRQDRDKAQEPIDEISEQITRDREYYEKNKDDLSVEERRELEETIETAVSRYRKLFELAQEDIDRQEKKLLREVFDEIDVAIQEVGAKQNYHLIFESGEGNPTSLPGRTGSLLYHSTTLNMTQRVIDHLNGE